MRTAFIKTLENLAAEDDRIWLVCGDLGFSVLESFAAAFPSRFVNAGVAEQNMTGIAAGLAMSGKIVLTYSIANFPVMRCLEQIRDDVCYHNLNVKIVSVGGGLVYGSAGYTHHAVEDLGVMRLMPNMSVFAPADPIEVRQLTRAIVHHPGPCYMRLGRSGCRAVHQKDLSLRIGEAVTVRTGQDIALIGCGGVLGTVLRSADILAQLGHRVTVMSMPTIQPLDLQSLADVCKKTSRVITVEDHGVGGLGSAVAEALSVMGRSILFKAVRIQNRDTAVAGSQLALEASAGLGSCDVVAAALHMLGSTVKQQL